MWTLRFWQDWPRANRTFLFLFFIAFAAALAYMWAAYFIEPSPTIELQTIKEAHLGEIPVDNFSLGPFDFNIKGSNYVILQRQLGSVLATSTTVAYVYLMALTLFVIGMLAVISTLGRFYYLVCMGIFILFVNSLSPEVLGVLGQYGKTFTIVMMAFYCLPSFWLFYFGTTTSFLTRVLVFAAVTLILWAIIYFFSVSEMPFLHLATYSAQAGMIACVLFIVTVSHEIVAAFVVAVTQTTKSGKSLNHFILITTIYFINLGLVYLVRFGFIKWDLVVVDLFLLLSISAILGIWGIRQRQKTYEGIIDGDPYAVFAFLLMGSFTFCTIGMFMLNANDPALSMIRDIIIFSHLGFGLLFVIYVLSNFMMMLAQNYAVHKVLYSSNTMPFFTFRFAGFVATLAIVASNTWQVPVHNAMAGYYNGIGDLYSHLQNSRLARAYYDESRTYGFHGHHSNYAMANIEGTLFNAGEERNFYADASGLRPTEMSYLNWAQSFQAADDNLSAIATLSDGIKKMKDHESLENTLGLLYAQSGLPDSAAKYLARSIASSSVGNMATANMIGLRALNRLPAAGDSVGRNNDAVATVNRLALMNSLGHRVATPYPLPTDTVLALTDAAGLSNYLINARGSDDTTFVRKVVTLARKPSNAGFKEPLLFAAAISLYNSGETKEAFMMLEEVTVVSELRGKYNNILTMWALENDEPRRAIGYADYAVTQKYPPARLTHAVALTENLPGTDQDLRKAITGWDSVTVDNDTVTANLKARVKAALLDPQSDGYLSSRYHFTVSDSNRFFDLVRTVPDDNARAKVILELAQKFLDAGNPGGAIRTLQRIVGLELTDASIGHRMQILEMLARISAGQTSLVLDAFKQNPMEFKGKEKKYRVYLDALAARAAGDSTNANKYFLWLGTANPYFEDGLIAAADYFQNKGNTSYDMLAAGILYHPSSVRIMKAYTLESARQGFEDYARTTLNELQPLVSARELSDLTQQVDALLAAER